MLYSFRLVLEAKTGKEIPESSGPVFLVKFLANNFVLSDAEYNTSRLFNRRGIADLPFWEHYYLNFTLDLEDLLSRCKQKPWRWEAKPDIYNEEYIHQFQPETTHKIH